MFLSLLDDPHCRDNLLIDWEHPSCIPRHKIGLLDDVHSAKWYADTHRMRIQSDSNEVLCGIILFIDQMLTADNDHQGSECPLFTLSILPRHICNQAWVWHPLGFIPKFESHHSHGQNMQALHLVLTHILSGLCGIQEIGALTTIVLPPSLSQQITLTFKVPIAFIVGDVKGHDKLCGRYKVHHNIKRLCHECNCLVEDADDPNVCCVWTRASDIASLVDLGDLNALKEISYHAISNAFTPLNFGANIYGINGCCPGKNLHMVQKGLMSYALVAFYQNVLTKAPTTFLDKFCKEISTIMSHQSDCNYPRTSFTRPLLMLSQLCASKYPGVPLILVMSLYLHACWSPNTLDDNSLGNSPNIDAKSVEELHHLFKVLLCFEAWYWLDAVPKEDVDSGWVSSTIWTAIEKVVAIVDRQEGLGMKLTMVHCPTHTDYNLTTFGSNRNTNSGPPESGHKEHIKNAKLMQH